MSRFFGDKGVFSSMTAWGVFVLAMGNGMVDGATQAGFLTPEGTTFMGQVLQFGGTILAGFGARRAIGNSGPPQG